MIKFSGRTWPYEELTLKFDELVVPKFYTGLFYNGGWYPSFLIENYFSEFL
jgi:hypothetical protein